VFKRFHEIATTKGGKSQTLKEDIIKKMLVSCEGQEAKYLIRALQGKMRIGLAESSVLVALGNSVVLTPSPAKIVDGKRVLDIVGSKSNDKVKDELEAAVEVIKQVFSECPDLNSLIPALLEHGIPKLHSHCHLTAGQLLPIYC
jgi:DNA ligase-1